MYYLLNLQTVQATQSQGQVGINPTGNPNM